MLLSLPVALFGTDEIYRFKIPSPTPVHLPYVSEVFNPPTFFARSFFVESVRLEASRENCTRVVVQRERFPPPFFLLNVGSPSSCRRTEVSLLPPDCPVPPPLPNIPLNFWLLFSSCSGSVFSLRLPSSHCPFPFPPETFRRRFRRTVGVQARGVKPRRNFSLL